jgi:hypothetical protein
VKGGRWSRRRHRPSGAAEGLLLDTALIHRLAAPTHAEVEQRFSVAAMRKCFEALFDDRLRHPA